MTVENTQIKTCACGFTSHEAILLFGKSYIEIICDEDDMATQIEERLYCELCFTSKEPETKK